MIGRRIFHLVRDPVWSKISTFSSVLFFVLLADSLLAFWVPNFLQDRLGSAFLMGLVMSFSSIIGFGADLIFPTLLRSYTVSGLIKAALIASTMFILSMAVAVRFPHVSILLIGMTIWGVYYEYTMFASHQFVADSVPLKLRSGGWAIIDTFKNLAYFIGPFLAGFLLMRGEMELLGVALLIVAGAFGIFFITRRGHDRPLGMNLEEVSLWREIGHWKALSVHIWPIVVLSLFMGIIDAMFWTTGAVWSEKLSSESFWASLIIPAYQLPALFVGFVLPKFRIFSGKKKLAEFFLMLNGVSLALLWFDIPLPFIPVIIFVSSIFLSLVYPLTEAVYTDITARMGSEKKHMMGLSLAAISLAYVVGPVLSGYLAQEMGERNAFVAIGCLVIVVSVILLAITPKKLRLPQSEIATWSD